MGLLFVVFLFVRGAYRARRKRAQEEMLRMEEMQVGVDGGVAVDGGLEVKWYSV